MCGMVEKVQLAAILMACFLVFSLKYAKFYDIVVVVFTFHSPTLPAERKHP